MPQVHVVLVKKPKKYVLIQFYKFVISKFRHSSFFCSERKWQQLECISKQFEKEKQKLIRQLQDLHTKLQKFEKENSSLKENMVQRTSQFQAIQKELLEKASKSNTLEREVSKLYEVCIFRNYLV